RRTLPLLIRHALLALAIHPRQVFPRRRLDPRGLRQPAQKLLVALAGVAPHDRTHRRIGFQGGRIDSDPLGLQQPTLRQHPQHPAEDFAMRVQIDQPPRARNRRVVRRVLVQPDAHKAPQRQRVRQSPSNPALAVDALEIPDQQRPEVDPRRQRRPPVLGRVELCAPALDKLVEALCLQQLIQTLIERMPRSRRQLRVRNPDVFLLLPLLARAHCHAHILRTKPVDDSFILGRHPEFHHRLLGASQALSLTARLVNWTGESFCRNRAKTMGAYFSSDGHCESKGDIATLVLRVTGRKDALARRHYFGITYLWVDRQYSPDLSVIAIKNYFVDQYSQQLPFFMRIHPI